MDFNEDEALLAIVSVAAFAIVLCDPISERAAFNLMQPDIIVASAAISGGAGLLEQVTNAVQTYVLENNLNPVHSDPGKFRTMGPDELLARYEQSQNTMAAYQQIEEALAGFLTSAFAAKPAIEVRLHHMLTDAPRLEADIAISNSAETVIVEIKYGRDRSTVARAVQNAERQALAFLELENIASVVLVSLVGESDYEVSSSRFGNGLLKLVAPARNRKNE
jgi:hypothetical protein